MNWTSVVVAVLVVFASAFISGTGSATVSIDCAGPAYKGQRTEIKCAINGSLTFGIQWIRANLEEVVKCNKKNTECVVKSTSTNYEGVADSPTENKLIIKSYDPKRDSVKWTCRDYRAGLASSCFKHTIVPMAAETASSSTRVLPSALVILWATLSLAISCRSFVPFS